MKRAWGVVALVLGLLACGSEPAPPPAESSTEPQVEGSAGYDPAADAAADIAAAAAEAKASGRFVLVEVGGEWCIWCHHLEDFLASHAAVRQSLDETFVVVKVNYSEENKNAEVLGRYPEIPGYPHFFILDGEGELVESQGTAELEQGKSYDPAAFQAFIDKWAARRPQA